MSTLRFDGLVVLVTGSGAGLGRQYALDFAARGAAVVVNDLGGSSSGDGRSAKPADQVVNEIVAAGGKAAANYDSVEFGDKLVQSAIENFGRIDVVINNAGILRDRSFANMSDEDWDVIHHVHLRGAFSVTRAAWSYMKQQKFGRVIFTASPSGLYGNFGQANYSAAKLGLLGLCNTLSIEGQRYNILCNTIAPTASSRLTQSLLPPELHEVLKPEYVSPLVLYLCHRDNTETGGVFEVAGGWIAKLRWQRASGAVLRRSRGALVTPEMVRDHFASVVDFSAGTFPTDIRNDSIAHVAAIMEDIDNQLSEEHHDQPSVRQHQLKPIVYHYTERDVRLYALSVGVQPSGDDLKFVYEQHEDFSVLPTFAVIAAQESLKELITNPPSGMELDLSQLLHGEQYLEVFKPLPPAATLRSQATIVDVLDKGSGLVIVLDVNTRAADDSLVAYNQYVIFIKGASKFGAKSRSCAQKPLLTPPDRPADRSLTEQIAPNQAALFRLNGDNNPIHIDPEFAALGGFSQPILHGLCTYAIACRHVIKTFAGNDVTKFRSFKARFTRPVVMGETVKTEMWREGNRIHLVCKVVETGKACLEGAYVDLHEVNAERHDIMQTNNVRQTLSSDAVFQKIKTKIAANPEFAKKVNAVFLWNITDGAETVAHWTLDLRGGGEAVYRGQPKTGHVACTFTIADADMVALAEGRLLAQKAFMSGKLKIKGNLSLVQKLEGLFKSNSKL